MNTHKCLVCGWEGETEASCPKCGEASFEMPGVPKAAKHKSHAPPKHESVAPPPAATEPEAASDDARPSRRPAKR